MPLPFLDSNPKPDQLRDLIKYLSTYRDGSGNIREKNGTTRADSRQIGRCFAQLFSVQPPESRSYYDFTVPRSIGGGVVVSAASIKSKEMSNLRDYKNVRLRKNMRAYLEIANASAKDWKACRAAKLTREQFDQKKSPSKFGAVIMQRQADERAMADAKLQKKARHHASWTVNAQASVFLSVLYSPMNAKGQREYLVSAFPIVLPPPNKWEFRGKALVGLDVHGEVLYEWYAQSGSQLKCYPLLKDRRYGSKLFALMQTPQVSLHQKAIELFGRR